jgi:energy-coupling factor transporter transmembrane protein EcfT
VSGLVLATILLFVLPAPHARGLGAIIFGVAVAFAKPKARLPLIVFGITTVAIGAVIYGFTLPGPAPVTWGPIDFGPEGAVTGAAEMLRAIGLFSIGLLAARGIPAATFLPLVSKRPLPLYVVASLLRLVPSLGEDFERIRRAQKARGIDIQDTWRRPQQFLPILVPLFVNALRRARDHALMLHLAGITPRTP